MYHFVTLLLLRNDPLDAVWRESEIALDFVRKAKFRDMADIIVPQQRFIATMQGRTATFSTFNDAQFDEVDVRGAADRGRMPSMICWYWIMKAKARFLSGALCRGARSSRQGDGPALVLNRPFSLARLLFLHRADDGGAL